MEIIETDLEFNSNYSTRNIDRINRQILHHSGTTVLQDIETIHNYHKNTRGYAGIGYHFYVRKDGTIYRGRPIEWIGAHAYGNNADSIGICAEGDFNEEEMPKAQKNSLIELVSYLKSEYGTDIVQAHRDVINTSCPGNNYPFEDIVRGIKEPTVNPEGDVAEIQRYLNAVYNLNIAVDNIYGNETKKALVKALQIELNEQFGRKLDIDGIFGPKTKDACICVMNGATGPITYLIKAMLICHAIDIELNDRYNNETVDGVKEFQERNELIADGKTGKETFYKLFR